MRQMPRSCNCEAMAFASVLLCPAGRLSTQASEPQKPADAVKREVVVAGHGDSLEE